MPSRGGFPEELAQFHPLPAPECEQVNTCRTAGQVTHPHLPSTGEVSSHCPPTGWKWGLFTHGFLMCLVDHPPSSSKTHLWFWKHSLLKEKAWSEKDLISVRPCSYNAMCHTCPMTHMARCQCQAPDSRAWIPADTRHPSTLHHVYRALCEGKQPAIPHSLRFWALVLM
jgi:hypothetical protein